MDNGWRFEAESDGPETIRLGSTSFERLALIRCRARYIRGLRLSMLGE